MPGEQPTVCEHPRSHCTDQTPVLPGQAIQDLDRQVKILGAKIDAFVEARRGITQSLRTDGVHVRLVFFFFFVQIYLFKFIRNLVRRSILFNRNAFRVSRK